MPVLYRKYRPQLFADLVGQEHVRQTLLQEVASGRLSHSYLFTGPRGVGKTTAARILAKAVNCGSRAKGSGEPCGECASCLAIAEGRALDVIEIDAASHTGVDNVREQVIEHARFAPSESPYKVFIIDEVHMLSTAAFNALLKTLEEPPAKVIFILATTEIHKLPATVVSRCQRFDFRKIGPADMAARLAGLAKCEGVTVADEVLAAVIRQSEGCLRDAESLLSQLLSLGEKKLTTETAALVMPMLSAAKLHGLACSLASKDAASALRQWDELAAAGADPVRTVSELTDIIRASAMSGLRGKAYEPPFPADEGVKAGLAGTALSPAAAADLLQRLSRTREEMRKSDWPELPFEIMLMEWAGPARPIAAEAAEKSRSGRDKPPDSPPVSGDGGGSSAGNRESEIKQQTASPGAPAGVSAEPKATAGLEEVAGKWPEVLRKAQEKNPSLPYMLGAAELLSCEKGELTIGFPYAIYRDRLNEPKYRSALEAALLETVGAKLAVKTAMVARRAEGGQEPAPTIAVKSTANLPEGFAELVKEFGGTVVG